MKRVLLVILVGLSWPAFVAEAQVTQLGVSREIVVSAGGVPQSPWVVREVCRKTVGACEVALVHPETGEVAQMGDVLGTDFERTGNGEEIRRVESAIERATRLKAAQ